MSDNTICIDDDCPLPEHEDACPEERTLEMWRAEAQRCRAMIGQLDHQVRTLEDNRQRERELLERLRMKPIDWLRAWSRRWKRAALSYRRRMISEWSDR